MTRKRKFLTLLLACMPGAGHMYLGDQKKGLIFMGAFFFTIFFMGWLGLNFLVFILPLIWFYSFFDAYHTLNGRVQDIDISGLFPKLNHRYIGGALIAIGILVMFQNMIYPLIRQYFDYRVVNYFQTIIVSLVFIFGGIKIIKGKNSFEKEYNEDEIVQNDIVIQETPREDRKDED